MGTKTLALDLGVLQVAHQNGGDPPEYQAGWYVDQQTGMRVFYDPNTLTFYTMTGAVYIPLGYMNPAPKQVTLGIGDKLKITISYNYSGPAVTGAVERFCIGVYGAFGFDEKVYGTKTKDLPASTTPVSYTDDYTLTIPSNVGADWDDIYCKISGGSPSVPENLFGYENALIIAGLQPTITGFKILDFVKA
jgi:hypothetical protein